MAVLVHLMGGIRLVCDQQAVAVGGPKQQAVLAALALSAGHRVSTDRLIDLVWDDHPPPSARRTIQSYVSSLRRSLGSGALLESSVNGYKLVVDRGAVDLLAFEDEASQLLADHGLAPAQRAQRLEALLSTWAPPLDSLRDPSRLAELTAPVEELRLQSLEAMIAAQIDGSSAGEAVTALRRLVREHPTRENLWLELARGLNQLGRRDDALNALQRAREALREHLGVNPSASLVALETELVNDEPKPLARSIENDESSAPLTVALPAKAPTALSSFVGREDEIVDIARLLSRHRLVTLRGLGGIGKTSLALQVAANRSAEFPDGLWFIDLAYVAPAATMAERFLAAVGLAPKPEVAPLDQLLAEIGSRRVLLVIDNCEPHIAETAELVTHLVRSAPNLHLLATSRTALGVAGETIWHVEPLPVSAAVALFVDRARLVRHDMEFNDGDREVVQSICEKLDGIPLGIELAAARLSVLSLNQIYRHLDDRFELLRGQAASHRSDKSTLRSALDWSFGLLDVDERNLLKRLVVFPAGFTLEAARDVCAADQRSASLVTSLALLVEVSLLGFDPHDGDPRYRLLETVREYVAEMLTAAERAEFDLLHATHYAEIARRIDAQHLTDFRGAMEAGDRDLDNLRAAMTYAFEHGEPDRGLSIARHLRVYYLQRLLDREFLRWLQVGLEQVDPSSDEGLLALANALVAAANAHDVDQAEHLAKRVAESIDPAQGPVVRARLLSSHAAYMMDSDPRAAATLLMAATTLVRDLDPHVTVACIHNLVMTAWRTGEFSEANAMIAALDAQPDGEYLRQERLLVELQAAACVGQWEKVLARSAERLGLSEAGLENVLHFRAEALGALGRVDEALAILGDLGEGERFVDRARSNQQIIRATTELRRGDAAAARSLLVESAAALSGESDRVQGLWIASLAAVAASDLGDDEGSAMLFGYARAIADEFDIVMRMSERPLIDEATRRCRQRLGPDRFDEFASRGASSNWASLARWLH